MWRHARGLYPRNQLRLAALLASGMDAAKRLLCSLSLSTGMAVIPLAFAVLTCGGAREEATAARGERLYGETCALCHGSHGEGHRADEAPRLASQEFLSHASDDFLRRVILDGRPATTMSASGEERGGPFSSEDANAVITHLRSWQTVPSVTLPGTAVAGDVARGAAVYDAKCRDCHGDKGKGGRYLELENPVFLASATDAYIRAAIERGRPDTPMPAFGSRLSSGAIDDVVVLARSWQRPVDGPDSLPPGPGELEQIVVNPGGPEPAFDPSARFVAADSVKGALDSGASFVLAYARLLQLSARRVGGGRGRVPRKRLCACCRARRGLQRVALTWVLGTQRTRALTRSQVAARSIPQTSASGRPVRCARLSWAYRHYVLGKTSSRARARGRHRAKLPRPALAGARCASGPIPRRSGTAGNRDILAARSDYRRRSGGSASTQDQSMVCAVGETVAAVRAFQKARGLIVDGIVGPKRQAALLDTSAGRAPSFVE